MSLYCDLISHWRKRNREAVEHYNPDHINRELLAELTRRYGQRRSEGDPEIVTGNYSFLPVTDEYPFLRDEFAQSGIRGPEDIRDIFVNQFYFGCEGDDPLNAMAFRSNGIPFEIGFNALYGSDIGHWDVPEMSEVAEEAYELVERGLISKDNLRQFVFDNAVSFWTANRPNFFAGTAVEKEVSRFLANSIPTPIAN